MLKIGKNTAEQLAAMQQKAQQDFSQEKFKKLQEWSVENECSVEAVLRPSINAISAQLFLRKMTNDELNALKKALYIDPTASQVPDSIKVSNISEPQNA